MSIPVILIFDVGKTNKKLLLFDRQYNVLHEESIQPDEITDEDGFACENLAALTQWIWQQYWKYFTSETYDVQAVNFAAYGASLVHINDFYKPLTPLYNYLKPYPEALKQQFYDTYGGEDLVARETASPVLGSLNSGMQLYRLKYEQPHVYQQTRYSLHLPQYLSFIISSRAASDITSVGCHTHLWDFNIHKYHRWVYEEGMRTKFAPIYRGDNIVHAQNSTRKIAVGIGLHDSSAALIPYLDSVTLPFVLISTGTWCISLNPFNDLPLTGEELRQDCLCYLSYTGRPVKAARVFAGYEHEQEVKRIAAHFNKANNYFTTVAFDVAILNKLQPANMLRGAAFSEKDLTQFATYEDAYHQLIAGIVAQQVHSARLVLTDEVTTIFVDGGFGKNEVYMNMLAAAFPAVEVYAASVAQASALGAALAIEQSWNSQAQHGNLIRLRRY